MNRDPERAEASSPSSTMVQCASAAGTLGTGFVIAWPGSAWASSTLKCSRLNVSWRQPGLRNNCRRQTKHACSIINGKQLQDGGLIKRQGGLQRRAFDQGVLVGIVALVSTCCFPAAPHPRSHAELS